VLPDDREVFEKVEKKDMAKAEKFIFMEYHAGRTAASQVGGTADVIRIFDEYSTA